MSGPIEVGQRWIRIIRVSDGGRFEHRFQGSVSFFPSEDTFRSTYRRVIPIRIRVGVTADGTYLAGGTNDTTFPVTDEQLSASVAEALMDCDHGPVVAWHWITAEVPCHPTKEGSMSEITREQVERALANVREVIAGTFGGRGPMSETFGPGWNAMVPDYVVEAFQAHGWKHMEAALERWLSTFPPIDHKAELEQMARPRPAEDPAPTHEVVDVPQPIVKRCKGVEVWWNVGDDRAGRGPVPEVLGDPADKR